MLKKIIPLLLLISVLSVSLSAQSRFALVIGNNNYTGLGSLKNPVNDATDIAAALESLGFKVELLKNSNLGEMERAVVGLKNKLSVKKESTGFFYYAGHGVQSGGQNFLIPIDADILDEAFLKTKTLSTQVVMDLLQSAGNNLNMVILDACRDNPFSWSRSSERGLSVVGSQPPGSIIVYATSAGSTAKDGSGRNGMFTSELLRHIKTPGIEVSEVFRLTGAGVRDSSGGSQIPAVYTQYFDKIYLAGPASAIGNSAPSPSSGTGDEFVLVRGGTFQMGSTSGSSGEKPVHSVTVSSFYMGKYEISQKEYKSLIGSNPSDTSYGIGNKYPVNNVNWYEAIEYCNALSLKEGLTPVYSGSGDSISCNFNVNGYRLPTEAEWEYAARGGASTRSASYSGSNNIDDVAWYKDNSGSKTHPVGGKQANELGLYDMSGNVWEWCWDWYGSYSSSSQTDPTGASLVTGRVSRGGGWSLNASYCRSANRGGDDPSRKISYLGFRVVRRP